ncbi:MAG: dephospho-CoA kinase [Gammaproteobacteria bacterium]|nr:dephospho-CoA kinase [Gammaproteobacteria bacterium]MBU1440580.1 dephospho-CoA kinase [Gammaproteobacteria bacterium]MBU2288103.1 dephospho-CoA kinase [Gammaproteobacteria bacterium]MBU2409108.1 dephospho-CoA kinase [Gammaproteobacteria bacterium]
MRVGLTGGIGSGKSTVAAMLAHLGAAVIDTDAISKALTLPSGGAMAGIAAAFGSSVIAADGSLDRSRMRQIAFADPDARKRLEQVLHPLIGDECNRQASVAAAEGRDIVFDVPLLVESGRWRSRVDRVLVVDATEATQVDRVVARSSWTIEAVRSVIDQQATRILRRASADAVIFNETMTLPELELQVSALWTQWAESAAR